MEKEMTAAVVGALGGICTGALAALVTLRLKGLDRLIEERKLLVATYDAKLLDQRLPAYKTVWNLTEPTSRRHVSEIDFATAAALAAKLTSWYYEDGGILLSEASRDAFFAARDSLEEPERSKLAGGWHSTIVTRFSTLRSALTEDLNSRRGPTLRAAGRDGEKAPAMGFGSAAVGELPNRPLQSGRRTAPTLR